MPVPHMCWFIDEATMLSSVRKGCRLFLGFFSVLEMEPTALEMIGKNSLAMFPRPYYSVGPVGCLVLNSGVLSEHFKIRMHSSIKE